MAHYIDFQPTDEEQDEVIRVLGEAMQQMPIAPPRASSPYAGPRGGGPREFNPSLISEGVGPLVARRMAQEQQVQQPIIAPDAPGRRDEDILAALAGASGLGAGGGIGGAVSSLLPTATAQDAIRREEPGELSEIIRNQLMMSRPKGVSRFTPPAEWARQELGRSTVGAGPADANRAAQSLFALDDYQDFKKWDAPRQQAAQAFREKYGQYGLLPLQEIQDTMQSRAEGRQRANNLGSFNPDSGPGLFPSVMLGRPAAYGSKGQILRAAEPGAMEVYGKQLPLMAQIEQMREKEELAKLTGQFRGSESKMRWIGSMVTTFVRENGRFPTQQEAEQINQMADAFMGQRPVSQNAPTPPVTAASISPELLAKKQSIEKLLGRTIDLNQAKNFDPDAFIKARIAEIQRVDPGQKAGDPLAPFVEMYRNYPEVFKNNIGALKLALTSQYPGGKWQDYVSPNKDFELKRQLANLLGIDFVIPEGIGSEGAYPM